MEEASFLVELEPMLRNRDLILYHYFAQAIDFDDAPEEHRRRAREHLDREEQNLGGPDHYRNFLRLRSFGAVAADLQPPSSTDA
jgi:hypothetical protein